MYRALKLCLGIFTYPCLIPSPELFIATDCTRWEERPQGGEGICYSGLHILRSVQYRVGLPVLCLVAGTLQRALI